MSLLFGNVTALMEMAKKGVDISAYWFLTTYIQENSNFQDTAGSVYTYDLSSNYKTPVYYFHKDILGRLLNQSIVQTNMTNNETFNYVWDNGNCPVSDGCPVSTPNVSYQTAMTVKSNNGEKLYLLVVNVKNENTPMQLNINGGNYSNNVKTYTISGNSFLDQNTLSDPDNITTNINDEILERVVGGYTKTFDKYSVTLIEFNHDTPPVNQTPVVNAGLDQTITLPSSATLVGTATDDGLPNPPASLTKTWSKVLGSGTVTFSEANNLNTTVSFSAAGVYTLRLSVTDSVLTSTDDIIITVNQAPPAGTVANSTFNPVAGTYTSTQSVTITSATSGATIRYTTNGSDPTSTTGTVYSAPVSISTTTTLKAIAYKSGMSDSSVTTAIYTINPPPQPGNVATPVISPNGGTYTTNQTVTITTQTVGANIRYTTNGSDPTESSSLYTIPLSISSTTTLKARAFKTGMNASSIASATFTINPPQGVTEYIVVGTISFRYYNIPITVTIKSGSTVVKTINVSSIASDNRIEFRLNANEVGAGNYTLNIKPRYYTAREGNLTLGTNQNVTFTVSGEYFAGKYTTSNPDKITILDISRFLAYFRASDHSKDLNGDQRINLLDLVKMLNDYRVTNT